MAGVVMQDPCARGPRLTDLASAANKPEAVAGIERA